MSVQYYHVLFYSRMQPEIQQELETEQKHLITTLDSFSVHSSALTALFYLVILVTATPVAVSDKGKDLNRNRTAPLVPTRLEWEGAVCCLCGGGRESGTIEACQWVCQGRPRH